MGIAGLLGRIFVVLAGSFAAMISALRIMLSTFIVSTAVIWSFTPDMLTAAGPPGYWARLAQASTAAVVEATGVNLFLRPLRQPERSWLILVNSRSHSGCDAERYINGRDRR
ncbi:MAG: hypothetical protein WBA88_27645 [Pseudaminobacter sp.]